VTVHTRFVLAIDACARAQVVRIVRRTMTSVAGGGPSDIDGRDRYKLAGRDLAPEEAKQKVRA
jgi:hypothetical protein